MKIMSQKMISKRKKLTAKQKKTCIAIAVVLLIGILFLLKRSTKITDSQNAESRVPVVVTKITKRRFERFIAVQGNLESKNFAVVSPRIAGTIEQIYADEGDSVIQGKSKLFKTDSIKLQEAVEIQKYHLAVEKCSRREAIANLEKIEADFHKAELDYHRFERLLKKQAITADAFEQQQSRYKQLKAAVKLAKANVELTAANVRKAEASLTISEKDLADTIVYAPISGKISHRFKEPGEMGLPGEPVVHIDDTSLIEVSAYLPAQYYAQVMQGETKIKVVVSGEIIGEFPVYYKSPTINPKFRTFEVKSILKKSPQSVVPGAIAQIKVVLESRKGLGIPAVAIQKRNAQSVIFVIKNDTAHMVPVKTGLENDGWTEIVDCGLVENTPVVSMGQSMIEEGTLVSVQKEQM